MIIRCDDAKSSVSNGLGLDQIFDTEHARTDASTGGPVSPRSHTRNGWRTRQGLAEGRTVPNKYGPSGKVTTNTVRDAARIDYRRVEGDFNDDAIVASNVNIPYLYAMDRITDFGYAMVAVVRSPIFMIASWNTRAATSNPEYRVTNDDLHPRWRHLAFTDADCIHWQAVIWRHYANLIAELGSAGRLVVLSSERIVSGGILLENLIPALMNTLGRYQDVPFDRIQTIAKELTLQETFNELRPLEWSK